MPAVTALAVSVTMSSPVSGFTPVTTSPMLLLVSDMSAAASTVFCVKARLFVVFSSSVSAVTRASFSSTAPAGRVESVTTWKRRVATSPTCMVPRAQASLSSGSPGVPVVQVPAGRVTSGAAPAGSMVATTEPW